ncbi:MAG: AraC family transcriptional regulator [Paenibacillaceae bacterium]|nr:AraC family transcriptional regulator [Paenibacillaceae bacterium]
MTKKSGVFLRFFISYLLILCIPTTIGAIVYQKTVRILEEESQHTSMLVLEHSRATLDEQLEQARNLVNRLSVNPSVLNILDVALPLTDDDYYKLNRLMNEIDSYVLNSSTVLDFNLIFKNADTTVSSKTIFHGEDDYEVFHKFGNDSYADYMRQMTTAGRTFLPPTPVKIMKTATPVISYVSPLRFDRSGSEPSGAIVVFLDTAEVSKHLNALTDHFQGEAIIVDDQGQIMASTSEDSRFIYDLVNNNGSYNGYVRAAGGKELYFVSSVQSDSTKWKFYSFIPKKVLLAKAFYIKRLTILVSAVVFAIGALVACALAYRQSKPIRELFQVILSGEQRGGTRQVWNAIRQTLLELISNKQKLQAIVERQTPLFYHVFFEKLISGKFKNDAEIVAFAEQAGIRLGADRYVWIIIEFHEYEEGKTNHLLQQLHFAKFVLGNLMNDLLGGTYHTFDLSEWKTACLYASSRASGDKLDEELRQGLDQLLAIAINKFQFAVKIAVGREHADLLESWKHHQETKSALELTPFNTLLHVAELDFSTELYFPVELEVQLIHACKSGDTESLERLLDILYKENFEQRVLSTQYRRLLLQELTASLIKLNPEAKVGLERKDRDESVRFEHIRQALAAVCAERAEQKKSHYSDLSRRMIGDVEAHFDDPNMSLGYLSAKYSLSESYISLSFKEYAGDNFSTFLENVRISKAREYLEHSNKSIQEIAALTGYNSDKTFRRAFKRVTGVQPTAYRGINE